MKEIIKPIITEVGLIYGRDAIFLDKINIINEKTFELLGEFSGSLCENLKDDIDVKYKIIFKNVHLFKMTEIDFNEIEYNSSFDEIVNSKQLIKMNEIDKDNSVKKIDRTYKHYVFSTYDTIFEIIGKEFILEIK